MKNQLGAADAVRTRLNSALQVRSQDVKAPDVLADAVGEVGERLRASYGSSPSGRAVRRQFEGARRRLSSERERVVTSLAARVGRHYSSLPSSERRLGTASADSGSTGGPPVTRRYPYFERADGGSTAGTLDGDSVSPLIVARVARTLPGVLVGSSSGSGGACRAVNRWATEEVEIPVERFFTRWRKECERVKKRIEERVRKPVEKWVSREERKCKKRPWWHPARWFCEIALVVVKVVTWVVVTVVKWVVYLVCKLVRFLVRLVVMIVIRVLKFVGTFLVCLFTDPLQALVSLRDLWSDLLETVEEVVDFAQSLLDDVVEILDDIERLVDSLASSFGVVGAFFASVLKWALHMGRDLLGIVRDLTEGIQDVVFGILRLNWCRIASGGVEIGLQIARAVTWVTRIPFGLLGSARDSVTLHEVESEVDRALRRRFGDDEDALERARDRVGVGSRPMGLPMEVRPVRLFVSTESEVDLRDLHRDGVIDLYAMAGHASRCPGGPLDRPTGEVVYAGTDKTVSYRDIDLYLAEGPEAVAEFHAFAIRTDRFRRYLDTARRKAAQLGVQLWWKDIGAFEVHDRDYVPLDLRSEGPSAGDDTPPIGGERRNPVVEQLLADVYGRTGRDDPLCEVPLVAVFSYTEIRERQPFGFASWFRPPSFAGILGDDDDYEQVSGATFRDRQPYWPFQFVPIHEVGHYLGLDHANHETPDLIMMSPVDPNWISQRAIVEYLLLTGEPRFTLEDLRMTWRWVTEVADDACFG